MSATLLRKSMIAVTIVALAAAGTAMAQGRGQGHGSPAARPGGPRGLHSRGLLAELIFPCQSECNDVAKTCTDSADETALSCISGACATEVGTAQAACGEDRTSEDCKDAVVALDACADSCLDTRAAALDECRDALRTCRNACEGDE